MRKIYAVLTAFLIIGQLNAQTTQPVVPATPATQPAPSTIGAPTPATSPTNQTSTPGPKGNDTDLSNATKMDYEQVREFEIGGLTVQGDNYLNEGQLLGLSGLKVGQTISVPGDNISQAVRKLWDTKLLANVEVYISKIIANKAFIEFKIEERPRLSGFSFRGVRKNEADEIRDVIGLIRGRVFTESLEANTLESIEDYYLNKGFHNVKVNLTEVVDPSLANSVKIAINVNKGDKVKVDDIYFVGAENAQTRKLKQSMGFTKERTRVKLIRSKEDRKLNKSVNGKINWFDALGNISIDRARDFTDDRLRLRIFSPSKFIRDDYEEDKVAVINYYNSLGYRDARIIDDSIFMDKNGHLNLLMNIEEGHPYYFRDIHWSGNKKYTSDTLSLLLGIKSGETYNKTLLESRLNFDPAGLDIRSLYMDDGYLFFNLTPKEILVGEDSIDIAVEIYEGAVATIDNIIINGNTKTSEHVIRRELRTLPGRKFSRSDLIQSQRQLGALGFFNQETIGVNPIPNPKEGTVDIEYQVEEKPSDQLELSAGWSGDRVVGSVGVTFNNFSLRNIFKKGTWDPLPSGDGQKLSLRFQTNGRLYQSLNASFTEPWLGGKRANSFTFSIFSTLQSNGIGKLGDTDYRGIFTNGGSIGYGMRLRKPDDFFNLQFLLTYQRYRLDNYSTGGFVISDGVSNNLSFTTSLTRSSISDFIYPKNGALFTVSMQLTPPYHMFNNVNYEDSELPNEERYKWIEYHKWKYKAEWYKALTKNQKLVLKVGAKGGFLGSYSDVVGESPFERFDVGGDGISNFSFFGKDVVSHRGYEQYTPAGTNSSPGGSPIYNKFTLELRYPVSLNPNATIYGLAFLDGANSYDSFQDYNPFKLRRSAGLGLRVFLPMFGLLGFDYGIRFDEQRTGEVPALQNTNGVFDYLSKFGKFSVILGFEPE